jgi:hypothetical protein
VLVEACAQAMLCDRAAAADRLGLLDLQECRTGGADREEQLGVLVSAGRLV